MDYKETLLLPTTEFPMRGNLPENEPARLSSWYGERKIYEKMKQKRQNATKSFAIHDGPPYANGHLHIGHALNKILKDIITKTHYFFGENICYVPGWDCHGLPIEQQVEVKLGESKKTMSKSQIREHCRAHAREFIDIQRDEFKTLGIIGDFENPYLTMKFEFEADIYRALCEIAKRGLLIERSKPVYWSWAAKSALAEAEVEYEDKEDYSIYVAFELGSEALSRLGVSEAKAVIWTTTPWTLPANQAISLSPSEPYVLTQDGLILAAVLLENLTKLGITNGEIKTEFRAEILVGSSAINPLNGRESLFLTGDHVTMDGGTGLVHTAPGHGEDDYYVCLKNGITDVIMPVDDGGCYDSTLKVKGLFSADVVDEFVGLHIFKANDKILELLGDALLHSSKFIHSYPHCWRTHKPVIYRATKQWFIVMDDAKLDKKTLRQTALSELEKVKFYPAVGIKRIGSMIENRPDWCISRQRDWGVPIAFFRHKETKEPIFDADILENVAKIFDEKGADAWWDLSVPELLPASSKYKPENLEKVMDILDVWFDSGSTWRAVLNSQNYDAGEYPSSMYLEGSDQHRGWFQSSLLVSTAVNSHAPYKSVLTHGFTVDENGQKMSKSKGNVVAPQDVAKTYGVEILRLWVGLSDYSSDLKISDGILKQVSEQYRKIRNTIRFLLANVNDLKSLSSEFTLLDRWILARAKRAFDECEKCFKSYDFSKGFNILLNFLSADLSGIYLDVCKDRLYCDAKDSKRRKSAQTAMALITRSLLPLIAPTLTYTVDEVMEYAPDIVKNGSIDAFDLVCEPIKFDDSFDDELLFVSREKFFELIDALKKDKKIKTTLELVIESTCERILSYDMDEVADIYMVSSVRKFSDKEALCEFEVDGEKFKIVLSDEHKCPRCWKFNATTADGVCPRCQEVLDSAK
ncbi:isoleucine--tRNA ligase [Campylobacter suis]|uniref:Isoleucine--tRNA ligase n=1 Tax=Campylobacter suis TaxID=2790657 RepID=A0ABM8Q6L8_9BACT|nr:isoleucine--tRNA ligase [Campylobacter suis]CAD7288528.1 Isoleucine--tRNA ligase [Campylobacter suis]